MAHPSETARLLVRETVPNAAFDMPPPPARRLILIFGSLIAALNLVIWTASDYAAYGVLTPRGLMMGLFVLTAVLLFYVILRLALMVLDEEAV